MGQTRVSFTDSFMRLSRKKDVPYLTGYLKWQAEQAASDVGWPQFLGCLGVIGTTIGVGILTRLFMPWWVGIPVTFVAMVLSAVAAHKVLVARKAASTPEFERQEEVKRTVAQLKELQDERKLHKWVDPAILQLIEAACYHWTRVKATLDSPTWDRPDLGQHWQSIKQQSWQAANHALEELFLMSRACIGEPTRDKQAAVKDVMNDFRDLDVVDALQGLSKIATSDWRDYAYQSPQTPLVFEPGRKIAERIKALADEIERTSTEIPQREYMPTSSQDAVDSLDGLLSEIRAVREAETELHQQNKA